jgi:xylulokinase
MDLLLGLDVGTTATKALAFDLDGNVVASASHGYGLLTPRSGWVEQSPEDLWRAVVETSRAVSAQLNPSDRIIALSQSSQAGTTIPVSLDGSPTYNAISWMDERGEEEARRTIEELGDQWLYRLTGWPPFSGLPLQHIAWFRRNRPEAFARTHRFLFVNDFIGERLTGIGRMNPADATITQLINVATGDWDERLLAIAGIRRDQVSPMIPSGRVVGTLSATASEATTIPSDALVVNGAHDQYCAAVALGATQPGLVMLSCGTAWVVLAVPESLEVGLQTGLAVSCHAVPDRWGAIRSLGGIGTSMEWLVDTVWNGDAPGSDRGSIYGSINDHAAASPTGSNGVLFVPMVGGHATMLGGTGGGFFGLSLSSSRGDLARAVMEGVAFELRWVLEEIREAGLAIDEMRMVGGAAKSPLWPSIVADVTGTPVVLPAVREAASRGAAILAGVGAGVFRDADAGSEAWRSSECTVSPDSMAQGDYDGAFERYQSVWGRTVAAPVGA